MPAHLRRLTRLPASTCLLAGKGYATTRFVGAAAQDARRQRDEEAARNDSAGVHSKEQEEGVGKADEGQPGLQQEQPGLQQEQGVRGSGGDGLRGSSIAACKDRREGAYEDAEQGAREGQVIIQLDDGEKGGAVEGRAGGQQQQQHGQAEVPRPAANGPCQLQSNVAGVQACTGGAAAAGGGTAPRGMPPSEAVPCIPEDAMLQSEHVDKLAQRQQRQQEQEQQEQDEPRQRRGHPKAHRARQNWHAGKAGADR